MRKANRQITANNNWYKGFTLVEVLVVLGIILFVGTIVSGIFFGALRAANKANTITIVRQSGDYAISQIAKTVRYAQGFAGVSNDGATYLTDCTVAVGSYKYLRITDSSGGPLTYSCNSSTDSPPNTIVANNASLINTNSVTVVPSSCSFVCTQQSLFGSPNITIQFTLSAVPKNGSNLSENVATIPFQTSVTLRNFTR